MSHNFIGFRSFSLAYANDGLDSGVWWFAHKVESLGAVLKVEVVRDDGLDVNRAAVEQRDALGVPARRIRLKTESVGR